MGTKLQGGKSMKKHLLPGHKSEFDKKFDEFFGIKFDGLDLSVIDTLADSCPKKLLPVLAASFDVNISALSETSAREMIKDAFRLHYYSGTLYALKKALKAFLGNSEVKEWFSYAGRPYHFKVEIEIGDKPLLKDDYRTLDDLIKEHKNVRSVLESISLKAKRKINEFLGSAINNGELIKVMPFVLKDIKRNLLLNFSAATVLREKIKVPAINENPFKKVFAKRFFGGFSDSFETVIFELNDALAYILKSDKNTALMQSASETINLNIINGSCDAKANYAVIAEIYEKVENR